MKNLNSDIRLTDALERQLLAQAIESQQAYALDRAVKQFFQKIISFFKAPKTSMHHKVSTAH
ncbi:MAG: hypothetical protein WBF69_08480 [Castellaniella sp.]|uniref:hypothetical protein n=1 Tax=Castellaniella sp. TaxID=1955812 RepID=UPI003C78E8E5